MNRQTNQPIITMTGVILMILAFLLARVAPADAVDEIRPANATAQDDQAIAAIRQAMKLLEAGEHAAAVDACERGLGVYGKPEVAPAKLENETQIRLHHVLMVASMREGKRSSKAVVSAEKLGGATMTNRAIQLNNAILDMRISKLPRAIDRLEKYLEAAEPDEAALNLYGYAIQRVETNPDTSERAEKLWKNYEWQEKRLTPPAPGLKHWGSKWVSAKEYASSQNVRQAAQNQIKSLGKQVELLEKKELPMLQKSADETERQYLDAKYDPRIRDNVKRTAEQAAQRLAQAQDQLMRLRQELLAQTKRAMAPFDDPPAALDAQMTLEPVGKFKGVGSL